MPAGNFCRINEAPSFGFPPTTNISSPGWFLGSTGFHGMASLVVKVPCIAPAFAPAAGVAPVPRSCAKDCVVIVVASATTTLVNINTLFFSIGSLLFSRVEVRWQKNCSYGHKAAVDRQIDSSNVAALVRRQEHRCGSNLLRLPDVPHRNHRLEPFFHRIRVFAKLTFENRCFDGAGADHVRADSFA